MTDHLLIKGGYAIPTECKYYVAALKVGHKACKFKIRFSKLAF